MARPRKEGLEYFPHDVTLSTDKKVEALRILHGNDGYAFYCIILENIYQEPSFELNVSDAETIQILAKKIEVTPQKFNEMLKTSIKHGCFDRERFEKDGVLTSNGIKKRAEVVVKKRVAMRESYGKKVSDDVSDAETTAEMPQSKSKRKVKEKESKDKNNTLSSYTSNPELISTLESFIEFRKKIKKPMTEKAISLLLGNLDKLASNDSEKIAVLEQSILNGWQGIFALKGGASNAVNGRRNQEVVSGVDFGF